MRARAEVAEVVLVHLASCDAVFVAQRPARLKARNAGCLDESAALHDVCVRTEVVVLERGDLNRQIEPADERLAIRQESVLPIRASVDQLQAEVTARAEEISMRDRCGGERRDAVDAGVGRERSRAAEGATDGEVFPFLDGDGDVARGHAGFGLRRLDIDALENAEAIQPLLRLEDRRVAERLLFFERGRARHHIRLRVGVAAHDDVAECDLRPLGDRVDNARRGLVGAHVLTHMNLNFGVAAVGVVRLQRDDVVALERRIQRAANFQRRLRQVFRRNLLVSFDRD